MQLPVRLRSIRSKLILVFLIAVVPVLCLQVLDELYVYRDTERLLVEHLNDVSSSAAKSISAHLDRTRYLHIQAVSKIAFLTAKDLEKIEALCKDLNATMEYEARSRFTLSNEALQNNAKIFKTEVIPLQPQKADDIAYKLVTPLTLADNQYGVFETAVKCRPLINRLPDSKKALGWQSCGIYDKSGRPLVAVQVNKKTVYYNPGVLNAENPGSLLKAKKVMYIGKSNFAVCGRNFIIAAARLDNTDWLVVTSKPAVEARSIIGRRVVLLWLSFFVAFAGLLIIYTMGNRLTRPIRRLANAAGALAVGDYRKRVYIKTGDEIQTLGEAFNRMGECLEKRNIELEKHTDMLSGMVEVSRIVSSSLDLKECAKAIGGAICNYFGADSVIVYQKDLDSGDLKQLYRRGRCSGVDWKRIASHAISSREYLVISESHDSSVEESILIGLPLATASGVVGAITARFSKGSKRQELELGSIKADMLMAFGVNAATALSNAKEYTRTEKYSEELEDWVEHLSAVMKITDEISSSLNLDDALHSLSRATAEVLNADVCIIYLPDEYGNLVVRSCSLPMNEMLDSYINIRIKPGESYSSIAYAEKRYVTCEDALNCELPESRMLAEKFGLRGILSSPLVVEEQAIGVLSVYSKKPRRFVPREIRLLTSICLHAAVVVRNARLYTREASIAETLQKGLLPDIPEYCQGLRFAGRYIPALDEARVGGDFYDVTVLPNGNVGIVIGDVSGKGLSAAFHLATCKYMIKALIYAHPDDPAAVVRLLNDIVSYYFGLDFFVTLFFGVIDCKNNSMIFANAGHPPPLLVSSEGRMHTALPCTGTPIGFGTYGEYKASRASFKPGDTLILYTDGVTESLGSDIIAGFKELHKAVFESGRGNIQELANCICGKLQNDSSSRHKDDVALLVVSFDGTASGQNEGREKLLGFVGSEYERDRK